MNIIRKYDNLSRLPHKETMRMMCFNSRTGNIFAYMVGGSDRISTNFTSSLMILVSPLWAKKPFFVQNYHVSMTNGKTPAVMSLAVSLFKQIVETFMCF